MDVRTQLVVDSATSRMREAMNRLTACLHTWIRELEEKSTDCESVVNEKGASDYYFKSALPIWYKNAFESVSILRRTPCSARTCSTLIPQKHFVILVETFAAPEEFYVLALSPKDPD